MRDLHRSGSPGVFMLKADVAAKHRTEASPPKVTIFCTFRYYLWSICILAAVATSGETEKCKDSAKVMGDREIEFLGVQSSLIVSNQKLDFSKSHRSRY